MRGQELPALHRDSAGRQQQSRQSRSNGGGSHGFPSDAPEPTDLGPDGIEVSRVDPTHLIVAGMHRSGTSLFASYLASLGIDMGSSIPADDNNPEGYFEDGRFLELNRRALQAATSEKDGGHRDWGWTESERFDLNQLTRFRAEAEELFGDLLRGGATRGWKDPRASLLLELWDAAAPVPLGGRYLLLYRYPWDVADSMQRLGEDLFLEQPELAYKIWAFYNRQILRFYRRHGDRCVLASSNALVRAPGRLNALLRNKLGLHFAEAAFSDLWDPQKFATIEGNDPLIGLVAATSPDCVELLTQLDREADFSAAGLWYPESSKNKVASADPRETVDLSVVIPCYNHGQLLIEAVASVERCVPEAKELIIVNDGSTQPRTLEVLAILKSMGFTILDKEHSGLAATRNHGIELATGLYILPLDADNRLLPEFANNAVRYLGSSPDIGVIYGTWREFGKRCGRRDPPEFDLDRLLRGNYIDACAVFRRDLWADVGGYDSELPAWEDWEFWIHAAKRSWRFHRLEGLAFDYRVRPGSLVTVTDDPQVARTLARHFVRKHRDLYQEHIAEKFGLISKWVAALEEDYSRLQQDREVQVWELARTRQESLALGQSVADLEMERDELAEDLARQAAQFPKAIEAIDRLETEREGLEVELERQQETLAERTSALAETERLMQCRVQEGEAFRLDLERSVGELDELRGELGRRTEDLGRMKETLCQRTKALGALREESAQQGRRLGLAVEEASLLEESALKLRRDIVREQGRRIALQVDLEKSQENLAERDAELDRQKEALSRLIHNVETRDEMLRQIHTSVGWRLLRFQWWWIDRLAPPSSARRRLWSRCVGMLKR